MPMTASCTYIFAFDCPQRMFDAMRQLGEKTCNQFIQKAAWMNDIALARGAKIYTISGGKIRIPVIAAANTPQTSLHRQCAALEQHLTDEIRRRGGVRLSL